MIVIGIDVGTADKKPIAIVTVDTDEWRVVSCAEKHIGSGHSLWTKYGIWRRCLWLAIERDEPDLVAIEDSRGIGGRGSAHLQTLVTLLKERAEELGVPVVLVKPTEAKAAVRKGNSTKEEIAQTIRALMDCSELLAGHDWTDAVAVALAGERKWQMEQLKKGGG